MRASKRLLSALLGLAIASGCGDSETLSDPSCGIDLRVTTFNIRFDGADSSSSTDDPTGWLYLDGPRRDNVVDLIREMNPDLMGVQEALANQVRDLTAALPQYSFVGVGRDDGVAAGEFAGVFYRTSRFVELESGHFWLSTTPDVPGTVFEGSNNTRMATWVRLRDEATARELTLLNTHWDHVSQPSREQSAALIRDRLSSIAGDAPVIVVGDLNAPSNSSPLAILFDETPAGTPRMIDGYRQSNPVPQADEGTVHFFTGVTNALRIDYVLHTDDLKTVAARIVRKNYGGIYPSDHFPVTSRLQFARDMRGETCPGRD